MPHFINRLLEGLSRDDLGLLAPHLVCVDLPYRETLEAPDQEIEQVYFVEGGVVSVVANTAEHEQIEAGLIGCEGVTGVAAILGAVSSPHTTMVQIKGAAHRISTVALRQAMRESDTLTQRLLRYAHVFSVQIAHTALANGRARLEERLARWLLMVHDRTPDDQAGLTHDLIALMLGVRRPGVTEALHVLEGKGVIRSTRGVIRVLDRKNLETIAAGTYGVPELEYQRLLG